MQKLSIVVPVFNEEENLTALYQSLTKVIDSIELDFEIIFVDDGSKDRSVEIIRDLNASDSRVNLVRLSRNFGHQIAVTAALDFARGDAAIILDADLQDPPELIPKMIERWQAGYDVVYGVRTSRDHETRFFTTLRKLYYRFLSTIGELDIPVDAGDFRLIDRRALNAIKEMREYNRYVRGLCAWVGFSQAELAYERPGRHAGESKYSLVRLGKLALNGITSFSRWPLHLLFYVGLIMSGLSFLAGVTALVLKLVNPDIIQGWASLVIFVSLISGIQLLAMGVMADYIGRIYDEVKNRPIYVVSDLVGLDADDATAERMIYSPRANAPEPPPGPKT